MNKYYVAIWAVFAIFIFLAFLLEGLYLVIILLIIMCFVFFVIYRIDSLENEIYRKDFKDIKEEVKKTVVGKEQELTENPKAIEAFEQPVNSFDVETPIEKMKKLREELDEEK